MKLAVTYDMEDNTISGNFEKTRHFKVYDIEDGDVQYSEIVGTMNSENIDLAGMLIMLEADALLCGWIGRDYIQALNDEGIVFYSGFEGDADEVVEHFINGRFVFGPDKDE